MKIDYLHLLKISNKLSFIVIIVSIASSCTLNSIKKSYLDAPPIESARNKVCFIGDGKGVFNFEEVEKHSFSFTSIKERNLIRFGIQIPLYGEVILDFNTVTKLFEGEMAIKFEDELKKQGLSLYTLFNHFALFFSTIADLNKPQLYCNEKNDMSCYLGSDNEKIFLLSEGPNFIVRPRESTFYSKKFIASQFNGKWFEKMVMFIEDKQDHKITLKILMTTCGE